MFTDRICVDILEAMFTSEIMKRKLSQLDRPSLEIQEIALKLSQ